MPTSMASNDTATSIDRMTMKCVSIPARYVLALLAFVTLMIIFATRVNLSVAIVAMVKQPEVHLSSNTSSSVACVDLKTTLSNWTEKPYEMTSTTGRSYEWTTQTQSLILGAFYYGYTPMHIPGGAVVQRFGGKWPIGVSLFITSLLTILTPIAAECGAAFLISVRVLQGAVQGPLFSGISLLLASWSPVSERSVMFTFVYTGSFIGYTIGMLVSGVLCDLEFLGGWPSVFYVFGSLGLLIFVFWAALVHESPSVHPRISDREIHLIKSTQETLEKVSTVPWRDLFTSVPVWAVNIGLFGYIWVECHLTMDMPIYLANVLNFDIKTNGLLCALPNILHAVCGMVASYFADLLRNNETFSTTTIRKMMNSIASFGSGACILLVTLMDCRSGWIIALLYGAMALNGFNLPGCEVVCVDMHPIYAGAVTGISNTFCNIASFVAPYVTGEITSSGHTLENWKWVSTITAIMAVFCGAFFNIFGRAELQPWGSVPAKDINTAKQPQDDTKFETSKL